MDKTVDCFVNVSVFAVIQLYTEVTYFCRFLMLTTNNSTYLIQHASQSLYLISFSMYSTAFRMLFYIAADLYPQRRVRLM